MKINRLFLMSVVFSFVALACALAQEHSGSVVELNKAVHFTSPGGEDVVAAPGRYQVEQQGEGQLRLVSDSNKDTLTVKAEAATHDEPVTAPVALSVQADEEDIHHLILLLQGGRSLDAVGSYSGIKSRGTVMMQPLSSPQLALAFQRMNNPQFGQFIQKAPAAPFQVVQPLQPWEQLWVNIWRGMTLTISNEVAVTLRSSLACQGNLQFDVLVRNVILATSAQKQGDVGRFLGEFQDRSRCLTTRGLQGLDIALSLYLMASMDSLPPDQMRIMLPGVFNLGLLVFDQLEYTRVTLWQIAVAPQAARMAQILGSLPTRGSGIWLHDFERGLLEQRLEMGLRENILGALANPSQFGDGTCSLLEMAVSSATSRRPIYCAPPGKGGGGQSQGTGLDGVPSGVVPNRSGAQCLLSTVQEAGIRGQMSCMKRSLAGLRIDPREAAKGLIVEQTRSVLDRQCAIGADAGTTVPSMPYGASGKLQSYYDGLKETYSQQMADAQAIKAIQALERKIQEAWALNNPGAPPLQFPRSPVPSGSTTAGTTAGGTTPGSTTPGTTSPETTTAGTSTAGTTTPSTTTPGTTTPASPSQPTCKPDDKTCQQNQGTNTGSTGATSTTGRTMGDDGGCGQGSNAAKRMKAMYQCMVGDSTSMQARPLGGTIGPGGGVNPSVAYTNPEYISSPMPAAMACAVQGGDMPRMSMSDPQCVAVRCMEGQMCPCNKPTSLGGNQMQPRPIRPTGGATPDCFGEGPCGVKPSLPGGIPQPPPGPGIK